MNKEIVKKVALDLVVYFVTCIIFEVIIEKIAWWIFSTTPEKSPFILAIINSAVIIFLTDFFFRGKIGRFKTSSRDIICGVMGIPAFW